jgi:hypothetical protein
VHVEEKRLALHEEVPLGGEAWRRAGTPCFEQRQTAGQVGAPQGNVQVVVRSRGRVEQGVNAQTTVDLNLNALRFKALVEINDVLAGHGAMRAFRRQA